MHPQAIVIDGTNSEESIFLTAMRSESGDLAIPLIELPEKGNEKLAWITKLDSSSLAGESNQLSVLILGD
jgi:hypothetical protein